MELRPCECGGKAGVKSKYLYSNAGWGKSYFSYWIECERCGRRSKVYNTLDDISPREAAIEEWNYSCGVAPKTEGGWK